MVGVSFLSGRLWNPPVQGLPGERAAEAGMVSWVQGWLGYGVMGPTGHPTHCPLPADASEFSCRELRSTRFVTEGPCRSAKPVTELVCSGQCGPARLLPNTIGRGKWWRLGVPAPPRCVPDRHRAQHVQLLCPGAAPRARKVRLVASCKCKWLGRAHNQSERKDFAPGPQWGRRPRPRAELDNVY